MKINLLSLIIYVLSINSNVRCENEKKKEYNKEFRYHLLEDEYIDIDETFNKDIQFQKNVRSKKDLKNIYPTKKAEKLKENLMKHGSNQSKGTYSLIVEAIERMKQKLKSMTNLTSKSKVSHSKKNFNKYLLEKEILDKLQKQLKEKKFKTNNTTPKVQKGIVETMKEIMNNEIQKNVNNVDKKENDVINEIPHGDVIKINETKKNPINKTEGRNIQLFIEKPMIDIEEESERIRQKIIMKQTTGKTGLQAKKINNTTNTPPKKNVYLLLLDTYQKLKNKSKSEEIEYENNDQRSSSNKTSSKKNIYLLLLEAYEEIKKKAKKKFHPTTKAPVVVTHDNTDVMNRPTDSYSPTLEEDKIATTTREYKVGEREGEGDDYTRSKNQLDYIESPRWALFLKVTIPTTLILLILAIILLFILRPNGFFCPTKTQICDCDLHALQTICHPNPRLCNKCK